MFISGSGGYTLRINFSDRIQSIQAVDAKIGLRAEERLDELTKPIGSLGNLEGLILRLSRICGQVVPMVCKPMCIVFAADHGVSEEQVSAYGTEVTEEMVVNLCMGSAVSSVIARFHQVDIRVVDVGVRSRVRHPKVIVHKVSNGTRNFTKGPAMTQAEAEAAVEVGMMVADRAMDDGCDLLLIGEMGIGNTTVSSALVAVLCDCPVQDVVGLGTGISDEQRLIKANIIQHAIEVNQPKPDDAWDVMSKLGGLEIAALAGAIIAASERGVPILLDGLITSVAALWATRWNERVKYYLIASHMSAEPAHRMVLAALELTPLLDAGLRLGEASGALLALPLVQSACHIMAETATFEDARVTNPHRQTSITGTIGAEITSDPTAIGTSKSPAPNDFSPTEQAALYKAILARRDIRVFLPDAIPDDVLQRILTAAHHAPSVGYMQPWNFVLIRDRSVLSQLSQVVERERVRASEPYDDAKKAYYLRLKVEGITQAPLTICVSNDPTRGGPHVLGRNTIPETDLMSTSCAIQNMWLAARVEGVAMGWVSIYQKQDVRDILQMPNHIDPVALLTIGYTPHFPDIPLLERVGWGTRLDMNELIFEDVWGQTKKG